MRLPSCMALAVFASSFDVARAQKHGTDWRTSALNELARAQEEACVFDQPPVAASIGIQVTKVGNVPTENIAPYSYNLYPAGGFEKEGFQFFIDQKLGKIYSYDGDSADTSLVFDVTVDDIPAGVTPVEYAYSSFTQKIQNIAPGNDGEVFVVLTSTTVPDGWDAPDFSLPAPVSREQCGEDPPNVVPNIYDMGTLDSCWQFGGGVTLFPIYPTFVKYTISEDGSSFTDPVPFFTYETQIGFGHTGGGMLSVEMDNGRKQILWSTGDCLPYGFDGDAAPQTEDNVCGKILLVDPDARGSAAIVAKGVRNSQHFQLFREGDAESVAFSDIGGVTREEVNAVPLARLIDPAVVDNFGWGRNPDDGRAREGTFYVGGGQGGILGTQPPCEGRAPVPEGGFVQPWMEFERSRPDEAFYAVCGMVVSDSPRTSSGGSKQSKTRRVLKSTKGFSKSSKGYSSKGKKSSKSSKSHSAKSKSKAEKLTRELRMPFETLKVVAAEMNTGKLIGTTDAFDEEGAYTGPSEAVVLRIFDEEGEELENHLNDLVTAELGGAPGRVDARPFLFVDGTAGILAERTGAIYKLTEIEL